MKQVNRRTMVEKVIIEFVKECDQTDFYYWNFQHTAIKGYEEYAKQCFFDHQARVEELAKVLEIFGLTEDEIADLEQLDITELNWKSFDEWCNVALTY